MPDNNSSEILRRFMLGGVDPNAAPPPNTPAPAPAAASQAPPQSNFFRQMLTDFVGTLAGSLKEGSFQTSVARGLGTRKRGSTASDAFAESFGALPQERQKAEGIRQQTEEVSALRRIREMRAKLEADQAKTEADRTKVQQDRLVLDRDREQRIAAAQQQQIEAGLRKAGLRTKINTVTGESEVEPVPLEELSLEERADIESKQNIKEYRAVRLDMERLRMELARERNETAKGNLQMQMSRLEIQRSRLEADIFGTIQGQPIPSGPTDAAGNPVGFRTFSATKPTAGELGAAASFATAEGTVSTVKEIVPKLREAISKGDIENYLVESRRLDSQLGLLANISRGIGGERGVQTEQDVTRARALLPSRLDIIKDFATGGRVTAAAIAEIEKVIQRTEAILMQSPNVRRILNNAKGQTANTPQRRTRFEKE